jgi:hypothetical protein
VMNRMYGIFGGRQQQVPQQEMYTMTGTFAWNMCFADMYCWTFKISPRSAFKVEFSPGIWTNWCHTRKCFFDNIFFCIVSHSVMPLSTRRTLLRQFSCFPLNLGRWTLTMNIAPTTMS